MSSTAKLIYEPLPEADSSHPQSIQHQHLEQLQQQEHRPWMDGDKRFNAFSSSIRSSDCNNNNNNDSPQRPSSSSSSDNDDKAIASQMMTHQQLQQQQQELPQSDCPFYMELRKKQYRSGAEERRPTRPLVQQMSRPLKRWLRRHGQTPYPTIGDKRDLARQANMTVTQVSNWFANARRRLKKTVRDPSLSWSMRIKAYNRFAAGKQELMSSSEEEDDERAGRIPSPDSTNRSQDSFSSSSVWQRNEDAVSHPLTMTSNLHRVLCHHKLSSASDCTETDDSDDDDDSDSSRGRRERERCPRNSSPEEMSPEDSAMNFDDDDDEVALQLRRKRCDGLTPAEGVAAPTETANHRSSGFVGRCPRQRRSRPTNIKSTRNSLAHGQQEGREETGKTELWTLEEIYSEMLRTREKSSKTNSSTEDLFWMEIGAAIALTKMARSCRQNPSSSSASSASSSSSSSSSSSTSSSSSLGSVGMSRKRNVV